MMHDEPASIMHKQACCNVVQAKARLERSMVVDDDKGGSKLDNVRTSSGTFLSFHEDQVCTKS